MTGRLLSVIFTVIPGKLISDFRSHLSDCMFAPQSTEAYPESWFRNVEKFSVREDIYYMGSRVAVVVKIYYRAWWKPPRRIRFVHDEKTAQELPDPHGKAQILIRKLKASTHRYDPIEPEVRRPHPNGRRMNSRAAGI